MITSVILWQVSFPGHSVEEMPFDPDRNITSVIEEIIQRLVGVSNLSIAQDYGLFVRRRSHKGVWLKTSRSLADYPHLFASRKVGQRMPSREHTRTNSDFLDQDR